VQHDAEDDRRRAALHRRGPSEQAGRDPLEDPPRRHARPEMEEDDGVQAVENPDEQRAADDRAAGTHCFVTFT
jgi:hypothetical protein